MSSLGYSPTTEEMERVLREKKDYARRKASGDLTREEKAYEKACSAGKDMNYVMGEMFKFFFEEELKNGGLFKAFNKMFGEDNDKQ